MIRFVKVIVWNLPRIYMIPRMAYMAKDGGDLGHADARHHMETGIVE